MSRAYTFCDFSELPAQDAAGEFGSKSSTLFQCTSMFTGTLANTPLNAYAVVDGLCAIQEIEPTSSGLVSIIIQPTNRVFEDVPVAYIILRGVKKDAFLDAGGFLKDFSTTTNQWLRRIADNQAAYNTEMRLGNSTHIEEHITKSAIGLVPETGAWAATDSLERIFTSCTLQKVQAGWKVGEFDTSTGVRYGMEVILRSDAWNPDLAYSRQTTGAVSISYNSEQKQFAHGEVEDFSIKQWRERILAFLDPCTFYSLFAETEQVNNRSGETVQSYSGADIQTNLLSKFHNPGKVYLDLRNHLGHSLNFYNDYLTQGGQSAQVQLSKEGTVVNPRPYHDGNGWPILVLTQADQSALGFTTSGTHKILLKFPLKPGISPIVFACTKHLFDNNVLARQEFYIPSATGDFTNDVPLRLIALAGSAHLLGTYLKLYYFIRYDVTEFANTSFTDSALVKQDTLDNLFFLQNRFLRPAGHLISTSSAEVQYVGCTSLSTGEDYLMRSGEAQDDIGSYFYSYMVQPSEKEGQADLTRIRVPLNILQVNTRDLNFIHYLADTLQLLRIYDSDIKINGNIHECLELHSRSHNYSFDPLESSADSLYLIALSTSEAQQLRSLHTASFINFSKTYLVALTHELASDDEDMVLFKLSLGLQGVHFDASTNVSKVLTLETGVDLFSRDGKSYFSESYVAIFRSTTVPTIV